MTESARRTVHRLMPYVVICAHFSIAVQAQELVIITCNNQGPCLYRRVSAVTVQGKNTVRTLGIQAASDVRLLRKAHSMRLDSMPGLYREPKSSIMRILDRNGQLGDVVLPSKLQTGAALTASSVWEGAALECREQPKSKAGVAVPLDQFVALLRGPSPERAAVDFIRNEIEASEAHPMRKELTAGALEFASRSQELQNWRDGLRSTMRGRLDLFREEKGDPARLEAILEEGLAAMRVYRLVAAESQKEAALQEELTAEHRRLVQRFAIASVLKKSGIHDPFLEKMEQIGLARWSRPEIVAGIDQSLQAGAEFHHRRATELFSTKQYARAFDEAQLASKRAPCNPTIQEHDYIVRVEFVNKNMILAAPEYEKENRSMLQQIVRELQGIGQESSLTPERVGFARKRISEGERLDKEYLPLQLKSAEFRANLGELTAAREVVTRVERTVQLGQNEAEEWLHLDASLNSKLATTRQRAEKQVIEHFASGEFREAREAAAIGLKAEPANSKLLYFSAVASAILRDDDGTKRFVEQYLRSASPACIEISDATKTLFDLYRSHGSARSVTAEGAIPHWISGELYQAGEVFYDPLSGGFFPRVLASSAEKGSSTEFRWEGFMVTSVTTTVGTTVAGKSTKERTIFEAEPRYDRQHIHMTEIGSKANSAGERSVTALRYLNSPEFDPMLAAKFTGKAFTRGWAGNPFFHPFLWTGIFIFDIAYDELGRIKEAIPVTPDVSRPRSPFSENLRFTWDGSSKRLLSISGARYHREMEYDRRGRLKSERITYPKGKGNIEYLYQGNTMLLKQAKCEDNFFDKVRRIAVFRLTDQ